MTDLERECEGHPAGPFDPMGETVYCDGSCVLDDEDYSKAPPENERVDWSDDNDR